MTSYAEFRRSCKMRYDFGDQIQVRYRHGDGEEYDTWVSGEEVLQRLKSDAAESRLKDPGRMEWRQLQELRERLPDDVRSKLESELQDRLADGLEEAIGDNLIVDNLANVIRGQEGGGDEDQRTQWSLLIEDHTFRDKVLAIAWIQLEGSFPDAGRAEEPNDWT